jgi:hypothetical protein
MSLSHRSRKKQENNGQGQFFSFSFSIKKKPRKKPLSFLEQYVRERMNNKNVNLWCDYLVEDMQKEIVSHLNVLARIRLSETCKACWKMFHPRPFPSSADLLKYVNDDVQNTASVIWYLTHMGIFVTAKDSFRSKMIKE